MLFLFLDGRRGPARHQRLKFARQARTLQDFRGRICIAPILCDGSRRIDHEKVWRVEARVGRSHLEIRRRHLPLVEHKGCRELVFQNITRNGRRGLRRRDDYRKNANLRAELRLDLLEGLRQSRAVRAIGLHEIEQQPLAAVVQNVVLGNSGIGQGKAGRAAGGVAGAATTVAVVAVDIAVFVRPGVTAVGALSTHDTCTLTVAAAVLTTWSASDMLLSMIIRRKTLIAES